MTDDAVSFDLERSDTADAVAMQDAFVADLAGRYPRPDGETGLVIPPVDPDAMVPPDGAWIVARRAGHPIGCGGLRRLDARTCEVKRVYLAPEGRGTGIARRLVERLHDIARDLGYRTVRLDTGSAQPEAFRLYVALGARWFLSWGRNSAL